MIVFQVSLNFDPAEESIQQKKIRCQIYILMKKVIILTEIQIKNQAFTPSFFNHFSLSLNRKKCVVMRATRQKLQKQPFADILQNRCS